MAYASTIRDQVFKIEEGTLFVSRDFEGVAPRTIVDRTLHRLTKNGIIVRITRGIFMRQTADSYRPTVEEVANAKARAFAKSIKYYKSEIAGEQNDECRFIPGGELASKHTYLCVGPSTSFSYGSTRINFRSVSPSKFNKGIA